MADQIYRGLKGDLQKQIDAKADNTTNFADASERSNIASGETMPTILGKIKKWFGDLKDLAFVAKDGTSSTKFLRGDGTWQNVPSDSSKADKAMGYLQYLSGDTPTDFNNISLRDSSGSEMGYPLADTEFLNHRFILVEVYTRNSTPADLLLCGSALLYVDSLMGFLQGSSIRIGGLPLANNILADAKFRLYYDDENSVYRAGVGFGSNASTALTGYYIRARLVD